MPSSSQHGRSGDTEEPATPAGLYRVLTLAWAGSRSTGATSRDSRSTELAGRVEWLKSPADRVVDFQLEVCALGSFYIVCLICIEYRVGDQL